MAKKKGGNKQPDVSFEVPTIMICSPYRSRPVALHIGPEQRQYYVSADLLQNSSWIASARSCKDIYLPEVDEDTGHVLAHYLHTGGYQTLNNIDTLPGNGALIEFKRAVLAYIIANQYELAGLQQLAADKIEYWGINMNIFDIINAINEDFSRLPDISNWFQNYLTEKVQHAFEDDYTALSQHGIFDRISNVALSKVIAKCVMELYNDKLSRMLRRDSPIHEVNGIGIPPANGPADGPADGPGTDEVEMNDSDDWDAWGTTGKHKKKGSKKNTEKQKGEQEAECKRKKDEEEAERKKKDDEAEAAAAAATPTSNDLSWADQVNDANPDDDWGSFAAAGKKKKGKKGKAADLPPPPPLPAAGPATNSHDIALYDSASGAPTVDTSFGDATSAKLPGFSFGGLSSWTSGWGAKTSSWGFDNEDSKDKGENEEDNNDENKNDDPRGSSHKKKKDTSGFHFNFDAFDDTSAAPEPAPVVEEKPAQDDAWGFSFGSKSKKKGKKGAAAIVEEPESTPAPEPEKPEEEEDPWSSYIFGSAKDDKKKKKGGALIEETPAEPEPEPVPEPEPAPEPEAAKEDDAWGWGSVSTGQKKKGKKDVIEEIKEDPIVEEPPPPPPEPAPSADDDWVSFAVASSKKKKKGEKGAKDEPADDGARLSRITTKDSSPKTSKDIRDDPVNLNSPKDDGMKGESAAETAKPTKNESPKEKKLRLKREEKKRLKREAKKEEEKEEQERLDREAKEAEEAAEKARFEAEEAEKAKEAEESSGWASSIWGSSKPKKETPKQKKEREAKERKENKRLEKEEKERAKRDEQGWLDKEREGQKRLEQEAKEAEEAAAKAKKEAEESSGWNSVWGSSKSKEETSKQKKEREKQERLDHKAAEAAEKVQKKAHEAEAACLAVEKPVTAESVAEGPPSPPPEPASFLEPSKDEEPSVEVQDGICPERAEHLLKGDMWRNCRTCRAMLRQLAIELARTSYVEDTEYEMVDRVLIGNF